MKCFIIAPHALDNQYDEKKSLTKKIAQKFDSEVFYASDIAEIEPLTSVSTIEFFKSVDFFIADLSYERPSCYFELGFAQSTGKNVFLIAEQGTTIHQTLPSLALHYYVDLVDFEKSITAIFETFRSSSKHNA